MKIWVFWLILVCVICGMFELLTPATPFSDALGRVFDMVLALWEGIRDIVSNFREKVQ